MKVAKDAKSSSKFRKKAKHVVFAQAQAEVLAEQSLLQSVTNSRAYEYTSIALIVLNAITIGWQVQVTASRTVSAFDAGVADDGGTPTHFLVIQTLFCIVFVADLIVRWVAEGLVSFLVGPERNWNIFDTVIVTAGVVESMWELALQNQVVGGISAVRVLRVLRVVRVLRALRLLSFFRELRLMVNAITGSLKSFIWSMMVLILVFYIFGLSMTVGSCEYLSSGQGESWKEQKSDLRDFFGSLDRSMFSLFQAMSGGRDWAEFYEALSGVNAIHKLTFVFAVSFSLFAIANVLAATFVESALQASNTDRETIIKEELQNQKNYLNRIKELFEEMDLDDTGTLSIEEFEKHLDDDRVVAYFNTLKLDVSDARTLFLLLDHDGSGSIDLDEFVSGCHRLKGESRSLDVAIVRYELAWLRKQMQHVSDMFSSVVTVEDGTEVQTLTDLKPAEKINSPGSTSPPSGEA